MAFGHPGLPSLHRYCLLRGRPPERGPGDPPAAGPGRPPAAGRWAIAGRGLPGMGPARPSGHRPVGSCGRGLSGMGPAPAKRPPGGGWCAIGPGGARPRPSGRRPVGDYPARQVREEHGLGQAAAGCGPRGRLGRNLAPAQRPQIVDREVRSEDPDQLSGRRPVGHYRARQVREEHGLGQATAGCGPRGRLGRNWPRRSGRKLWTVRSARRTPTSPAAAGRWVIAARGRPGMDLDPAERPAGRSGRGMTTTGGMRGSTGPQLRPI